LKEKQKGTKLRRERKKKEKKAEEIKL